MEKKYADEMREWRKKTNIECSSTLSSYTPLSVEVLRVWQSEMSDIFNDFETFSEQTATQTIEPWSTPDGVVALNDRIPLISVITN